ncbi:MAG TPA: dienelactone hydrolase family protein [Chthoniobacterales bacterium]|nr:dienelactone hydrolase family protein [Chthoniobacterales bacterium]
MHTEVLTYDADGLLMQSHLYFEDGSSRRPGVLVFPEAFGLSQHAKNQAQRLAQLGYVALACDLHGEGKLFEDLKSVGAVLEALRNEPAHIRARAKGGLDRLVARPEVDASRVAAIGYCFGGTMALELARGGNPILGVVGFHSGLATVAPQDASNIKGKILVCIGADDPVIPLEQRIDFENEMRNGGVDWQMDLYGGVVHSFTNPDADKAGRTHISRYNAKAAARSWASMRGFFDEIFA